MISFNWKKSLLVAAAATFVTAGVPAVSHAQYTGMTAPSVAMATTSVSKVSAKKTVHKVSKHKSTKKHKKSVGKKHKA